MHVLNKMLIQQRYFKFLVSLHYQQYILDTKRYLTLLN